MTYVVYFDNKIVWDHQLPYLKLKIPDNCYSDMRKGILKIADLTLPIRLQSIEEYMWILLDSQIIAKATADSHLKGELHLAGYKILQNIYNELSQKLLEYDVHINSISERDIRQGILFILESKDSKTRFERMNMFIQAYTKT